MNCCHVVEDAIVIVKAADDESVEAASMFLSRECDAPSVTVVTGSNIVQSVV